MLSFVTNDKTRARGEAGVPRLGADLFFVADGTWIELIDQVLDEGEEIDAQDTPQLHHHVVALRKLLVQLWCATRRATLPSLEGRLWRSAARLRLLELRYGDVMYQPWHTAGHLDAGLCALSDVEYDWAMKRAFLLLGTGQRDSELWDAYYISQTARNSGERDLHAEDAVFGLVCGRLVWSTT